MGIGSRKIESRKIRSIPSDSDGAIVTITKEAARGLEILKKLGLVDPYAVCVPVMLACYVSMLRMDPKNRESILHLARQFKAIAVNAADMSAAINQKFEVPEEELASVPMDEYNRTPEQLAQDRADKIANVKNIIAQYPVIDEDSSNWCVFMSTDNIPFDVGNKVLTALGVRVPEPNQEENAEPQFDQDRFRMLSYSSVYNKNSGKAWMNFIGYSTAEELAGLELDDHFVTVPVVQASKIN
jgi:hypothetical protein